MSPVLQTGFDSLLNFRDVGAFTNEYTKSNLLKPRLLFRSAKPDESSSRDRDKLLNQYKINTIIDLRSKTEHILAAEQYSAKIAAAQSAAVPISNETASIPLQIPGIRYSEINLNGKGFERGLIWKLRYVSLAKLIILMTLGYRTDGIAVLGREVMQPRGLIGLGIDTLTYSGPEIKEAFEEFADESKYPILIHCTQGKDRTGILIILLLLLCEVDVAAITADYMQSEEELVPGRAERLKEIKSIGLDESFAGCPQDFVEKVVSHLQMHHGGVVRYLNSIGISSSTLQTIKQILCNQHVS